MLAKLMKYELKATSRLLIPLYLIMVLMSIINRFVFMAGEGGGDAIKVIIDFLGLTFMMSVVAVAAVTVIYMIVRFYKNLLTDEGYLMFTLPVKVHELITSKLLITLFWSVAGAAAIVMSIFVAFADPHNLSEISVSFKNLFELTNKEMAGYGALMFTELGLMFALGSIFQTLFIYVSIAIGQLFPKHKIIGSFAAYMILYTVIQFAMMILMVPFGIAMSKIQPKPTIFPTVIFPTVIAIVLLGSIACYVTTNYILKRKLNLD